MYVYKAAIGKQFDYLFPHISSFCLPEAWHDASLKTMQYKLDSHLFMHMVRQSTVPLRLLLLC